jgi:serine/threonine-protein kinase RsbW
LHTITVRVPAQAANIHVLRSLIAAVASRADASVDDIADLQLAVDESATQLLGVPGSSTLTVTITSGTSSFEVAAASDGVADPWPPADIRQSLTWQVLVTLVDDVSFEMGASGPSVRLRRYARSA